MAVITPPGMDPVPTPAIQRGDSATFSGRLDAFINWLINAVTQFQALASNVAGNATDAATSATTASSGAITATTSAASASSDAAAASTSATSASASASSASTSASSAATSASSAATSSANALASANAAAAVTGIPSVLGKALRRLRVNSGATGIEWDDGVTNLLKGADVASAATTSDIWNAGGNLMNFTGAATVTAFPPAPNAGSARTLLITGSPTFISGANLVVKGGSYTASPGDEVDVEAETTTLFRLTVRKADGTAVLASPPFRGIDYYASSFIFVAQHSGLLRITLKGADGSGGAAFTAATGTSSVAASGGAAGGLSIKTLRVAAGDTFTGTLAAGGAAVDVTTTATATPGNAGGNSTITGPGVSMTANGGHGGNASRVASGGTSAAGAAGGTASGGDLNSTGGASGTATVSASSAAAATGGGAISWRGVAMPSGDALASTGTSGAASGGAGTGGVSGNATNGNTAGAGSLGASAAQTTIGTHIGGPGAPTGVTMAPLALTGVGGNSTGNVSGADGGIGAGGGAALTAASNPMASGAGGLLAGGGAAVVYNATVGAIVCTAPGSNTSGPSGGAVIRADNTGSAAHTGVGGNAFAIFEWL